MSFNLIKSYSKPLLYVNPLDTIELQEIFLEDWCSRCLWIVNQDCHQTSSLPPDHSNHNNTARSVFCHVCRPSCHSWHQHDCIGPACLAGLSRQDLEMSPARIYNISHFGETMTWLNHFSKWTWRLENENTSYFKEKMLNWVFHREVKVCYKLVPTTLTFSQWGL